MTDVFLAFDIGKLGAAAWVDECGRPTSVPLCLAGRDTSDRLADLDAKADALLGKVKPTLVMVERHTGYGKYSSQTLDAYTGVLRAVARRHGAEVDFKCSAMTASKCAIGKGIPNKELRAQRAVPILRIPKTCTSDEIDARILLAAAPGYLQGVRFKADMKRRLTNLKAKQKRAARRVDQLGVAP